MRVHRSSVPAGLLSAGLLLAALVPGVSAAPPKWAMSVAQLVPGAISDGGAQGFDITITNKGPSNISALYLFDDVADTPVYVSSPRAGCSAPGQQLFCSFGAVTKGTTFTVRVAYRVHGNASNQFPVTFELNTTGVVAGSNNSHGDALRSTQVVSVIPAGDVDRAGTWTLAAGDTLANSHALGASNRQATALGQLGAHLAASLQDGSGVSFNCPKSVCKAKPFGEWSSVNVNVGQAFATPFEITITVAKSALPNNPNLTKLVVYHALDGGGVEAITTACGASAPPAAGCRSASYDAAGNLVIRILTYRNGGFKGAF